MDSKHQQDLAFTHAILNYLTAAYQGRFAGLNILQQLAFEGLPVEEITRSRSVLEKVRRWVADMNQQMTLFSSSWTAPETFDAQSACQMLEEMRVELGQLAESCAVFIGDPETPKKPGQVKFLIAAYGRYAYARDNYIKGFVEYGNNFGYADLAAQYAQLQEGAAKDVETTHALLSAYKNPQQVNDLFFRSLFDECVSLPGIFRTHVHDINLLLAPFKGGITFESLAFFGPEVSQWQTAGFDPGTAGYWRAYFFTPLEATDWRQCGVLAASIAIEWKLLGIDGVTAAPWVKAGFPPALAATWIEAKYTAEQALDMIDRGIQEPPK
jgi:hypothetical protein